MAQAKFPEGKVITIDGLRVDFKDGFGLMRPSNTTPVIIFRFEGDTKEALVRIQNIFREKLLAFNKNLLLPF
jgi:phosphomannomutase / phosphoglucomutase